MPAFESRRALEYATSKKSRAGQGAGGGSTETDPALAETLRFEGADMAEATGAQRAALKRSLFSLVITVAIMGLLLFVPAGTLNWARGWWFLAASVAAILVAMAVLWRVNPDIFVARSRIQPGTKTRDHLYLTFVLGGLAGILPIAGLDFRFGGAMAPDWVVLLGYALFALGFAGTTWPQAVNRHFEPGVRIQKDRGQTVIDTGPYAIVRHPGYIAASVFAIGMALSLGSWWALVPALVTVVGLIPRTLFEEDTLIAELPGYREYTQRVRYRWVPGVW
jgi:protein-S-isoprenylcysteine O-methyltransferase Ste14